MIANEINGKIRVFNKIPKVFELKPNVFNYDKLDAKVHYNDGFRDLLEPTLKTEQHKTSIYFDVEKDVFTYHTETYTPEEIAEQNKQNEFAQYKLRQSRGLDNYLNLCAEFRIAKESGSLTPEHYAEIEEVLIPVRDELVNGQFITAKTKLQNIGFHVIGEQLYNRFIASLDEDINELY